MSILTGGHLSFNCWFSGESCISTSTKYKGNREATKQKQQGHVYILKRMQNASTCIGKSHQCIQSSDIGRERIPRPSSWVFKGFSIESGSGSVQVQFTTVRSSSADATNIWGILELVMEVCRANIEETWASLRDWSFLLCASVHHPSFQSRLPFWVHYGWMVSTLRSRSLVNWSHTTLQ